LRRTAHTLFIGFGHLETHEPAFIGCEAVCVEASQYIDGVPHYLRADSLAFLVDGARTLGDLVLASVPGNRTHASRNLLKLFL
jgi:hypothetical protein